MENVPENIRLVGRVYVPFSSITFQNEIEPRFFNKSKVEKLSEIYATSCRGCKPNMLRHHIPAIITPIELDAALLNSGLTRDDLQKSLLDGEYPILNTSNKIYCLKGRRRLEAAKKDPESSHKWFWTVDLFLFDLNDPERNIFLQHTVEQYLYESPFLDGEIYRKLRYYRYGDDFRDWMNRLSKGKKRDVSRILIRETLVRALDDLIPFLGLWIGLELGNMRNALSLHIDEELISYLRHIYNIWNIITLSNPAIRQAVDIETVEKLQMRAPSASLADRNYITQEMDNGNLFPIIRDSNLRDHIKRTILDLEVMIPSIKSFHENLKYIGIAAKILKSHLCKPVETLYQTMCSLWTPPQNFMVELREGDFKQVIPPVDEPPARFAYKQIFLFALRHFTQLSRASPRQEKIDPEPLQGAFNKVFHLHLLKRAQLLGFSVEERLRALENVDFSELPSSTASRPDELDSDERYIKRRWGIPFRREYETNRTLLFLPNLLEIPAGISPLFVQRDLLNAFFGSTAEFSVLPGPVFRITDAIVPPPILLSNNTETTPELERSLPSNPLSDITTIEEVISPTLRAPSNPMSDGRIEVPPLIAPTIEHRREWVNSIEEVEPHMDVEEPQMSYISTETTSSGTQTTTQINPLVINAGPGEARVVTTGSFIDMNAGLVSPITDGVQSIPPTNDVVGQGWDSTRTPRSFISIDAQAVSSPGIGEAVHSSITNDIIGLDETNVTARSFIDVNAGLISSPIIDRVQSIPPTNDVVGQVWDSTRTPRSFISINAQAVSSPGIDGTSSLLVTNNTTGLDEASFVTPRSFINVNARPASSTRIDRVQRISLGNDIVRQGRDSIMTPRSFISIDAQAVSSPGTERAIQSSSLINNIIGPDASVVTPRSFININAGLFSSGTDGESSSHITNDTRSLERHRLLSNQSFIPSDMSTTPSVSRIGPRLTNSDRRSDRRQGVLYRRNLLATDATSLYQLLTIPSLISTSRIMDARIQRETSSTSNGLRRLLLPEIINESISDHQPNDSLNNESSFRRSNLNLNPQGLVTTPQQPSISSNRRRFPINVNNGRLVKKLYQISSKLTMTDIVVPTNVRTRRKVVPQELYTSYRGFVMRAKNREHH